MPLSGSESLVRRDIAGDIEPIVVAGLIPREGGQSDQCHRQRRDQNGRRPPHNRGTDGSPPLNPQLALGFQQTEPACHHDSGGDQGNGHRTTAVPMARHR
ncbi:Uncharacterised protein [Mycobacteroides abscessus subsp. massiliense]|nr:Uncharacterised protein [Mycobacteroides abscessus subsp. massiliense]